MKKRKSYLKKPAHVGQVFDHKSMSVRLRQLVPLYKVQKNWESIVGKQMADRTYPVRIDRGRLLIKVENSSWTMHLGFIKEDILQMIQERLNIKLQDIQFETGKVNKLPFASEASQPAMELIAVKTPKKKFTTDESLEDILSRVKRKMDSFSAKPTK